MLDVRPAPEDALDRLNALAVTSPPGSNGVIFAPWLNGERTPVDDPYIRGGWFNVSLATTRADLARTELYQKNRRIYARHHRSRR